MRKFHNLAPRSAALTRAVQLLALSFLILGLSVSLGQAQPPESGLADRPPAIAVMEAGAGKDGQGA